MKIYFVEHSQEDWFHFQMQQRFVHNETELLMWYS